MRAFVAVAAREAAQWKMLFLLAPVLALLPFLLGFVPVLRDLAGTADTWAAVSMVLVVTYAVVVSLILGGTLFSRELAAHRLSFYFARPLPVFTVWAGKLAAAALLVVPPTALIATGVLIAHWTTGREFIVAVWLASFALILLTSIATIVLRVSSPLVVLDTAILIGLTLGGWAVYRHLHDLNALVLLSKIEILAGAAIVVSLVVSTWWVLHRGRTDPVRSRRALSVAFWTPLVIAVLLCGGVLLSTRLVTPSMCWYVSDAAEATAPDWRAVYAVAPASLDYPLQFLLNTKDGSFRRLPPGAVDVRFAGDGSAAFYNHNGQWFALPLGNDEGARPIIGATAAAIPSSSQHGRRLALIGGESIRIHDVATRHAVMWTVPLAYFADAAWLDDRVLRTITPRLMDHAAVVTDYDFETGHARTHRITMPADVMNIEVSPSGRRMLVTRPSGQFLTDVDSGRVLLRFAGESARFVGPDLVVAAKNRLRLLSADGAILRDCATSVSFHVAIDSFDFVTCRATPPREPMPKLPHDLWWRFPEPTVVY